MSRERRDVLMVATLIADGRGVTMNDLRTAEAVVAWLRASSLVALCA